jgi:hypothetical protein
VATLSSQGPHVIMVFQDEWIDRLAMYSKNQNIFVSGHQIKEVGRAKIVLDPCELIDDPAANVPAQSPNTTTRPRRRRSSTGNRERPSQG